MKLPPVVYTLNTLDAADGQLPVSDGQVMPMLRLMLTVDKQDRDGRHPPEKWPDLWLEPHTAVAFAQALHSALIRHLPLEAQRLGLVQPSPTGEADPPTLN